MTRQPRRSGLVAEWAESCRVRRSAEPEGGDGGGDAGGGTVVGQELGRGDVPVGRRANVRESGIGATTPVGRYHSGVSTYGGYDLWPGEEDRTRSVRGAVVGGLRAGCGRGDAATNEIAGQRA